MRLTCPNCGAQYDIPQEVIPDTGRDVQCSNCGDTWFQHHPDHAPDEGDDEFGDDSAGPVLPPDPEPAPAARPEPAPDPAPHPEAAPGPDPTRRQLDPQVAGVLREEAEREARARAAESARAGLEVQTELGLVDPEPGPGRDDADRGRKARGRMALLRGEDTARPDAGTGAPAGSPTPENAFDPPSRRNLLPDIDEINSSLDAHEMGPGPVQALPGPAPAGPGGFRIGFRVALVVAITCLLLYVYGPRIGTAFPVLEAPLDRFAALVNDARLWLQQTVASLLG